MPLITSSRLTALLGCMCMCLSAMQSPASHSGKIRGVVWNDRGERVSGAKVRAEPFGRVLAGLVPAALTDGDGQFVIERLLLEEYTVSAEKEEANYPNTASEFHSKGRPALRVRLTAAAPEAELSIVLGPKAAVVTGSIRDAGTGGNVPAAVRMWLVDDPNVWIVRGVGPNYRVLIPSNVAVCLTFEGEGYEEWTPARPLRLSPDQEMVVNVEFRGLWPTIDLVSKPSSPAAEILGASRSKLPLEIRLEAISQDDPPDTMVAQIRMTNTGSEPFRLPVGRNPDTTIKPMSRSRQEFWFLLKAPFDGEVLRGQPTYSSEDLPDSLLTIPPGAVVRVRFRVDTSGVINQRKRRGAAMAALDAICLDVRYEDNPREYIVQQPVREGVSANGVAMELKH